MTTILRIKRKDFDLIKSGVKKTEWREPSKYNKGLLFAPREIDGKLDGNPEIKEITFINGYKKDSERLTVKVNSIRMVKFINDVEIKEDNFKALAGQFAIEINLGEIIC